MTRSLHRTAWATFAAAALLAACSSSTTSVGTAADSTASTSSTVTDTVAPDTTAATTTATPSTVPATTAAASGGCDGAAGIPAGAEIGTVLYGDVDGDLADDTITEYSLDGVPHVHSQLATGGHSDAVVQIGFADHVSISFEDFDHSAGAETKPPVAVLAVGATKAGTAVFTFLTNTTGYCISPWHTEDGEMFVGRISAEGPYEGLHCDGAMGRTYYVLTTATPAAGGGFDVTERVMHHNFTLLTLDPPIESHTDGPETDVQDSYGDIVNCDTPPLFS